MPLGSNIHERKDKPTGQQSKKARHLGGILDINTGNFAGAYPARRGIHFR